MRGRVVLAVEHLEDSGLVHLQALRLQLEPPLELCDSLQLAILFVEQIAELLLVLSGLLKIVFVV